MGKAAELVIACRRKYGREAPAVGIAGHIYILHIDTSGIRSHIDCSLCIVEVRTAKIYRRCSVDCIAYKTHVCDTCLGALSEKLEVRVLPGLRLYAVDTSLLVKICLHCFQGAEFLRIAYLHHHLHSIVTGKILCHLQIQHWYGFLAFRIGQKIDCLRIG